MIGRCPARVIEKCKGSARFDDLRPRAALEAQSIGLVHRRRSTGVQPWRSGASRMGRPEGGKDLGRRAGSFRAWVI